MLKSPGTESHVADSVALNVQSAIPHYCLVNALVINFLVNEPLSRRTGGLTRLDIVRGEINNGSGRNMKEIE